MKMLVLVASLLMLCGAHAQLDGFDKTLQSDLELKENYGSFCTSLNGTEFSSLPRPEVFLQRRIDGANDRALIRIPPGLYVLSEPLHINKNVTIIGTLFTVINARRNCEILQIDNPNASVNIRHIAFVNGRGDYGGAISSKAKSLILERCVFSDNQANYGAGVYQKEGRLCIRNSLFNHNYAASKGGAVYVSASGPLTVKNCRFYKNNVTSIGAAIYAEHKDICIESSDMGRNGGTATLYASNSSVLLSGCNISGNLGPNNMRMYGDGGGIRLDNCSAVIKKCAVRGNKATYLDEDGKFTPEYWGFGGTGGGIYLLHSSVTINDTYVDGNEAFTAGGINVAYSNLTVNRGSISNNVARHVITKDGTYNGQCGGMVILGGSQVTLNGVLLDHNHADERNGAIYNSGLLHLTGGTVISGNTAPKGAGIGSGGGGILTVDGDVTISNNTAVKGAGIFNWKFGHIESKATISGNNAIYGSAIYNEGDLVLVGGKIENNKASVGGSIWNANHMVATGVRLKR